MAFTLCLVSVAMFGQLSFGASGNAKKITSFYKDGYGEIRLADGKYFIEVRDITTKEGTFKLMLGSNAESAKESLEQLAAWCKNAGIKDYIEVNQEDGSVVTICKYKTDQLIMSLGNIDYINEKYDSEANNKKMKSPDHPFGYMLTRCFESALEKMGK